MNGTSKLQLLSLIVIVSFLSIGVSVLLLLASGDWEKHDNHVYQQFIHTSLIIGRGQQVLSPNNQHSQYHPLTRPRQQADSHYYNTIKTKRAVSVTEGRAASVTAGRNTSLVTEEVNNYTTSPELHTLRRNHKRLSKRQYQKIREQNKLLHSSHDSNASNATAAVWLVRGQHRDISASDLCPHSAQLCTEFLTSQEKATHRTCAVKSGNGDSDLHCRCQFMNTTGHGCVGLVSLPGSGNTWLRGLLERATGVCTGSLFCDKILHAGGMCGEGLREGVLVVKTHDTRLQWTDMHYRDGRWTDSRPFFDAAIVLVRNPFKALISEWNRQNAYKYSKDQHGSSHIKYLQSSKYFLENKKWSAFVSEQLRKWKMIIAENLVRNRDHPVIFVYYEQLKSTLLQLAKVQQVLEFLQFPYSEEKVMSAVKNGYSSFYRNHTDSFQHFTSDQRSAINAAIAETANRLRTRNFTDNADQLDTYLQ